MKLRRTYVFIFIVLATILGILLLHLFFSYSYFSHQQNQYHQINQQNKLVKEILENKNNNNNINLFQEEPPTLQQKSSNSLTINRHTIPLLHFPIHDRDSVVRWIPRVNGAVKTDAKFHPRELLAPAVENYGDENQPQQNQKRKDLLSSERDHHHEVHRQNNYFVANDVGLDAKKSCFWSTPLLRFLNSKNKKEHHEQLEMRICASSPNSVSSSSTSSSNNALLREIENYGIIEAVQRDLDFERKNHHVHNGEEQQKDKENILLSTSDQLLLTTTIFGSENVVFEYFYDDEDLTPERKEQLCDFYFETLPSSDEQQKQNAVLGGGKIQKNSKEPANGEDLLFEDETYSLFIHNHNNNKITIQANSVQGFHHALRTFLLHAKENGEVISVSSPDSTTSFFAIPCLEILRDTPAMGWRSQHIDLARHFFTPETIIESVVRPMAWAKMNIIHLHLSDDQGWRVESAIFPSLHLLGGRRMKTLNGKSSSKKFVNSQSYEEGSKFWSVEEIWNFVQECRARGIRVMPEIDLPSHATALLLGVESEMLRFYVSNNNYNNIEKELTKRLQNRISLRQKLHEAIFRDDPQEHLFLVENQNNTNSLQKNYLVSNILSKGIPKAAKSIENGISVLNNPLLNSSILAKSSSNIVSSSKKQQKHWRRTFFGTFYHANSDCFLPLHLEPVNSLDQFLLHDLQQQHHSNKKKNILVDEFLSTKNDWSSQEFVEKFFSGTHEKSNVVFNGNTDHDDDENGGYFPVRKFIQSRSALNCMGGTHGIVDPSSDSANIFSLILNEVSMWFQTPLEYSMSKQGVKNNKISQKLLMKKKQKKNRQNNNNTSRFSSTTFGPTCLFHVGGDQAEFLRDFGWSPWILSKKSQNVIEVNGDEENDESISKKKSNNNKNNNGLDLRTQIAISNAFPVLSPLLATKKSSPVKKALLTTSYLQAILTSHFIHNLKDYSAGHHQHLHTKCAVWDETLLELDPLHPPPRDTIIIFWRDDGLSWKTISNIIMNYNKNQQQHETDHQYEDEKDSHFYFPLVFAGKTRLYFDYAQFVGGASGNKFWPLNTFGSWIPFKSSSLERVYLVPEVIPPSIVISSDNSFCSPAFSTNPQKELLTNQHLLLYFDSQEFPGFKIIGLGGNLWSELLIADEILRYQLFPRMFGVAEASWSFCLTSVIPTVRMNLIKMVDNSNNNNPDNNNDNHKHHFSGEEKDPHNRHFSCALQYWMQQQGERDLFQHQNENDFLVLDQLPLPESRCVSFESSSSPIMTSCKTNNHDKIPPVFYSIWESKIFCSAQFEESS